MKHREIFVFDLGGVLVHWDPAVYYVGQNIISQKEYEEFYKFMNPFNLMWDIGVSSKLLKNSLLATFPDKEKLIKPWFEQWDKFLQYPIKETVEILKRMNSKGYELYSITNWSRENFPNTNGEYEFLGLFSDIVISGCVGLVKPDKKIYQLLLDRNNLKAQDCIFIDDKIENIETAKEVGYRGIHFKSPDDLLKSIKEMGVDL